MCLAVPVRVVELDAAAASATVALGPVQKRISTLLLEEVAVGDYVLVHVGYAISRISPEEAAQTLALFAEAGLLEDGMT